MLNDNYNFLDKLIHKIILNNNFVGKSMYSLEKYLFLQTEDNIKKNKHIFISGLARSGSTLLLNLLHESNFFCSLTYSDMPFILAPNLWSKFNFSKKRNLEFINRAHSDLINISIHSPESFEEVFWKSIQNNSYITKASLIKTPVSNKHLKEYNDFISLICFKYSKKNYLTKNNNSILRLKEILSYFDNSFFLIPFRYPSNHVGSLINQHKRFKKIQKENNFTRKYMNWLGHYEFGLDEKSFNFNKKYKTFEDESNNYWLQKWIIYYDQIINIINNNNLIRQRIILCNYDRLCIEKDKYFRFILEKINIKSKLDISKKISNTKNYDIKFNSELLEYANKIYLKLNSIL